MSIFEVAQKVSEMVSFETGLECTPHDIEERSFELKLDGVYYDGGSYYINENEDVIRASVTPQENLGNVENILYPRYE